MRKYLGKVGSSAVGKPRRVVVLAFPGVDLLDVAGPAEVFSSLAEARSEDRTGDYSVELISTTRDLQIRSSAGISLAADGHVFGLRREIDTLIVPGGEGVWEAARDDDFLAHLRRIAPRVRRVGSVCTGAFLLAASGLLDGRRATTHWRWCDRLAAEHPDVEVEPDAIFVRDGEVYTSAGVTTGMDLALALVEEDLGRETALRIARHLVMFVRRPGGQSQFSPLLEMQAADRRPLRDLQAWIVEHLADDLSVEALADTGPHERRGTSPGSFARRSASTPARFVERLRVDAARRRLEETEAGLDRIARECGFGGPDSMRRSFLRVVRVVPSDYRDRFRVAPTL